MVWRIALRVALVVTLLLTGCTMEVPSATPTFIPPTLTDTPTETATPTETLDPTPTAEMFCVKGSWFTTQEEVTIFGIDLRGLPGQQSATFPAGTKFLFIYSPVSPSADGGQLVVTAEGDEIEGWLILDKIPAECLPSPPVETTDY